MVSYYLARYTDRVAISNHRLVSIADGKVPYRWKDYANGNKQRTMTVTAEEFLRASGLSGFASPDSSQIAVASNCGLSANN